MKSNEYNYPDQQEGYYDEYSQEEEKGTNGLLVYGLVVAIAIWTVFIRS